MAKGESSQDSRVPAGSGSTTGENNPSEAPGAERRRVSWPQRVRPRAPVALEGGGWCREGKSGSNRVFCPFGLFFSPPQQWVPKPPARAPPSDRRCKSHPRANAGGKDGAQVRKRARGRRWGGRASRGKRLLWFNASGQLYPFGRRWDDKRPVQRRGRSGSLLFPHTGLGGAFVARWDLLLPRSSSCFPSSSSIAF